MFVLNFDSMEQQLQETVLGMRKNGYQLDAVHIGNPMNEFWKDKIPVLMREKLERWIQVEEYMGFPIIVDALMPVNQIKIVFRNHGGLLDQRTITGVMEEV